MPTIKTIPIPALEVKVSPEDEGFVSHWTWMPLVGSRQLWYAIRENDGARMHRLIVERQYDKKIPKGFVVDHRDCNGLNNTRENLRVITRSENSANRRKQKNASSPYKGVHYHTRDNVYHAYIRVNHERMFLGCFRTEMEAARAYDAAAKDAWGDCARLNLE